MILYGLGVKSPMRFTELQNQLKIQPKTLTSRLHELAKLGVIERTTFNEIPPRVEYDLTQKGKDLKGIFSEAAVWSRKYETAKVRNKN
jgi:DNA-binding HxlR family transcriptional regulator